MSVTMSDGDLGAPARTLLFGPLTAVDPRSAVVHRLRAAIGLGLLPDGKRLPKEADLAGQLHVTVFALREALAELRTQGLVVTKPGKNGGSFVTHSDTDDKLEYEELTSLSSTELRDLGDWRAMLSGGAASLAATRASQAHLVSLREHADLLAEANRGAEARRAHARFHLTLASAAQSARITRAEFAVHEQVDWLFALALESPEQREETATSLRATVDFIAAQDGEGARGAAEANIATLVGRLAQLRLHLIAHVGAAPRPSPADSLNLVVSELVTALEKELLGFAADIGAALEASRDPQSARTGVSIAALKRFDLFPDFVQGLGFLAEADVIAGHKFWIEWWSRTAEGPRADNHHVLDLDREDFYDYMSMEFMRLTRDTGLPAATGPYVDYGGVDDFTITAAAPVNVNGEYLGAACVDILAADLEAHLASTLAAAPTESYLISAEGRVLVSNSLTYGVGDVVPDDLPRVQLPHFGWSMAGKVLEPPVSSGSAKSERRKPARRTTTAPA